MESHDHIRYACNAMYYKWAYQVMLQTNISLKHLNI
jgi:hypothetical protein